MNIYEPEQGCPFHGTIALRWDKRKRVFECRAHTPFGITALTPNRFCAWRAEPGEPLMIDVPLT